MPKITLNDINLYYETHGQGSPLLLIAGLSADHLGWTPILDELTKHYQVILFDNRGVGQSDVPDEPYSIAQMAEDAASLLEALQIECTHVIGSSMGGSIAQMLALNYPEKINKLVIYDSAAKFNDLAMFSSEGLYLLRAAGADERALRRYSMAWIFSEAFLENESVVDYFINLSLLNPHPQPLHGFKRQLEACKEFDLRKDIKNIEADTLVLVGENDLLTPPGNSKYIADSIDAAKLIIVPNMGHVYHLEDPQLFCEHVLSFLSVE